MESFFAMTKSLILRALIIYFVSSFFRRPAPATENNAKTPAGTPKMHAWNLFENGTMFDLHVYISENPDQVNFKQLSNLVWLQEGLTYGDWSSGPTNDGIYTHSTQIKATKHMMNNGSLYLHTWVTRVGESPDPEDPRFPKSGLMGYRSRQLNKFKRIKAKRNYNLLAGEKERLAMELENINLKDVVISHWHPNLTINLVVDQTNWSEGTVPQPLNEYVKFVESGKTYLPIVFINDYWNLQREYFPINETTPILDLHLTFQPLSMFKWQLYAANDMKKKWSSGNMLGELMNAGAPEVVLKFLKNVETKLY